MLPLAPSWNSVYGMIIQFGSPTQCAKISLFINIWFTIRKLNKYILYAKARHPKCQMKWHEMYKWKDDTKILGYEFEQLCDQG